MLSIKKKETYELAQELSRLTGETLTDAVTVALQERVERLKKKSPEQKAAEILAFGKEFAALVGDRKIPDHGEYLYDDETGLPK